MDCRARHPAGSLKLTIFYLFAVTAFLSLFVNNTAVAAMMLPLTLGILRQVDVEKNRKLYAFVLLGIAFSASIGGIGTLVGSTPNALLATMIDISFADWLKYGMPVVALMMPAMVLSLWVVLRPDFNVPFNVDIEDIPLDGRRMFTLVVFAATAVLLMPIFITVARTLQLPDIALASIIACGASCAFMLPIATPPNAIVYATGKIRLGEMVRVGLLLNIACILIIGLLAHGLWVHW